MRGHIIAGDSGRTFPAPYWTRIMPTLHVTSLSKLHETVAAVGAGHVVTLINEATLAL